jgi:hypothetical protein
MKVPRPVPQADVLFEHPPVDNCFHETSRIHDGGERVSICNSARPQTPRREFQRMKWDPRGH